MRLEFNEANLVSIPERPGIYIIYDVFGPIYVGRSGRSIQRRLWSHFKGRGNKNIAIAMASDARYSLTFSYWLLSVREAKRIEGILIIELGTILFGNLRNEAAYKKATEDDWDIAVGIARAANRAPT